MGVDQRSEGDERTRPEEGWVNSAPGRGNSRCKSPEAGRTWNQRREYLEKNEMGHSWWGHCGTWAAGSSLDFSLSGAGPGRVWGLSTTQLYLPCHAEDAQSTQPAIQPSLIPAPNADS